MSRKSIFLILILLLLPSIALAWTGECVGISDGDTITVLQGKKPVKIRLYGIDCPEKHQAFGSKASKFTAEMVFRKIVQIDPVDRDRYGRVVAWVNVDGKNLNRSLVRAGLAWHYKKYSCDQDLADLEIQARKAGVGIWSDPHAVPPWEFRRKGRLSGVNDDLPGSSITIVVNDCDFPE